MQAEVDGQKITWLTPHGLQQVLPDEDVVYDVLLTFLEFYEVTFFIHIAFYVFIVQLFFFHILMQSSRTS